MDGMQYTSAKDYPLMADYVKMLNDVLFQGQADGLSMAAALNCLAQVIGIMMAYGYKEDAKREVALQKTLEAAWHYTGMWERKIAQIKAGGH